MACRPGRPSWLPVLRYASTFRSCVVWWGALARARGGTCAQSTRRWRVSTSTERVFPVNKR
ncbi:hypothetical protein BC628DRAFT_1401371 [Trametes gibbosa]|nr:hypothetical protein BC628DRAFT_1401371 [Trametes gibbosa]